MADRNKFEEMLERLVNEDKAGTEELFHEIVVERSREIYENLLAEDEEEVDEANDEEVDESEDDLDEAADEEVDESEDELDEAADEEVEESDEDDLDESFFDEMGGDPADDMMGDQRLQSWCNLMSKTTGDHQFLVMGHMMLAPLLREDAKHINHMLETLDLRPH